VVSIKNSVVAETIRIGKVVKIKVETGKAVKIKVETGKAVKIKVETGKAVKIKEGIRNSKKKIDLYVNTNSFKIYKKYYIRVFKF